ATLGGADGRLSIYPNPAGDVLNILFPKAMAGPVEASILDALGRVVLREAITVDGAGPAAQFGLEGLAKGWYNLRANRPDGTKLQSEGFFKE
ncbi:MAG: T9SS type A sorting domain-containing protein, partial [Bacteroidetes bacterium]|nr:T9SS type A sorting domain-containing protein [Bacteroidota bacterium]